VDDAPALIALFAEIFAAGQTALVQSFIAGPNTNHRKVCAYFDAAGRELAVVCMRKIRQYPVDFGVGTLMETVVEPEVRELGLRFFRALRWRGPGSIEFKRDEHDGRWKLIELNPRLWQQHALAATAGVSFPLIQYLDATGRTVPQSDYAVGVRWLDEFRDPRSALEHQRHGRLTLTGWARSLRSVRSWSLWAADDPGPFLAAARHYGSKAWQAIGAPRDRAGSR
jgi:predicted ATP-grasp superfamily ATP-dependent carboligase